MVHSAAPLLFAHKGAILVINLLGLGVSAAPVLQNLIDTGEHTSHDSSVDLPLLGAVESGEFGLSVLKVGDDLLVALSDS